MRPEWRWTVVSLCRASDPDRAPRYYRVLERLGATGAMADLDDGPDQDPIAAPRVRDTVLDLLPLRSYDVILTHSPFGEYTRHRRHEEAGEAVTGLWEDGSLAAREVWLFAYDDDERRRLPLAIEGADVVLDLSDEIWGAKREIIVDMYGFASDSWEARATPRREAFWCCATPRDYRRWRASREGKR